MKTITVSEKQIYRGNLLLVNARYPYRERDMRLYAFPGGAISLRREAAKALRLALRKTAPGNAIVPVSGYRSLKEQTELYNASLKENGEEFTRKYVALPNHSEHQTGLAIDLGLNGPHIDFIRPDFPYDGICEAFRQAAPDYGFIQRYTEEKERITGIAHEPWHFRYVGYPHSRLIAAQGLCLEEYIEFIKSYREDRRLTCAPLCPAEIYYVPAAGGETEIRMEEGALHLISGNNTDGFIVTVWRHCDGQGRLHGHRFF